MIYINGEPLRDLDNFGSALLADRWADPYRPSAAALVCDGCGHHRHALTGGRCADCTEDDVSGTLDTEFGMCRTCHFSRLLLAGPWVCLVCGWELWHAAYERARGTP